jgi:large subunit ribosomal protein L29
MKAKDLREKSFEDLSELEKTTKKSLFEARFKNFTNRLDDTSQIKKARRELARVKTLLGERARAAAPAVAPAAAPAAPKPAKAPKAKAPKAEAKAAAPAAEKAEKKPAPTKTAKSAKKSEAK